MDETDNFFATLLDGNDPGAPKMNDSFLDKILNTGLAGYQAYATTRANQGPARTVTQKPTSPTWMPYAIIGGAVLLVVGLIFALKK